MYLRRKGNWKRVIGGGNLGGGFERDAGSRNEKAAVGEKKDAVLGELAARDLLHSPDVHTYGEHKYS